MNKEYFRKENEDELDYVMRLISKKKEERVDDLDWSDICDLLGLDLNKDSLRKSQDTEFGGLAVYNKMKARILNDKPEDYQNEVQVQLQELKKERIKIADERAALNRRLRKEARKEDIKDLALDCANIVAKDNPLFRTKEYNIVEPSEKTALLTLSDLHFGFGIDEFNNTYNPEVFKDRFDFLLNQTIKYMKLNSVEQIFVLGLGDYLSGVIHNGVRVENRERIVKQVINMSEALCGFLSKLSLYAPVYYYDVSDNHGRIFEKDDSANDDNFSLFIKWYLQARFKDIENIHIMDNDINEEIGTVEIYGRNYGFTHGHRDRIGEVVQNLSLMTKKFYDAIFIGHCHHYEATETHGTYVFMSGTLSGTDEYANNLRKTSNPSQNLYILNPKEGIECQYIIKL